MNDLLILGGPIFEAPALFGPLVDSVALTLAQDGLPNPGAPAQPTGNPGGGIGDMFLPLMIMMLAVMILMSVFSGRGEKKRRKAMLEGLSKRDRVQTTAGIIGTVVEMKGDEVVLKVDEASNTRIRFAKSAVQQVLRSAGGGGGTGGGEGNGSGEADSDAEADAASEPARETVKS